MDNGPGNKSEELPDYDVINRKLFYRRDELRAVIDDKSSTPRARRRAERQLEHLKNDIYLANRKLVLSIVNMFTAKADPELTAEYEAAGWLGFAHAMESYQPDKGRFSTWAWRPIQREVLRAVRSNEFNLTQTDFEHRKKILAALKALTDANGEPPSNEQVAEVAGCQPDNVERVRNHRRSLSLNARIDDSDNELMDTLDNASDDEMLDVADVLDVVSAVERHALPVLNERERYVIVRRLGLDGEPPEGLDSIGTSLGLSREAVRQIEARAKSKMLHPIVAVRVVFRDLPAERRRAA